MGGNGDVPMKQTKEELIKVLSKQGDLQDAISLFLAARAGFYPSFQDLTVDMLSMLTQAGFKLDQGKIEEPVQNTTEYYWGIALP